MVKSVTESFAGHPWVSLSVGPPDQTLHRSGGGVGEIFVLERWRPQGDGAACFLSSGVHPGQQISLSDDQRLVCSRLVRDSWCLASLETVKEHFRM